MDGKGTHRTKGVGAKPDTARVVDRSVAFDLPEPQYRSRGYAPPFDELSWKADLPAADPAAGASRPRR
jgi:hypothetical protein